MIGYADRSGPAVVHDPKLLPPLVMVSIEALAQAFFDGIDKFLVDLFADKARRATAEKRLPWLLVAMPFKGDK
jgi:hypothetical protein